MDGIAENVLHARARINDSGRIVIPAEIRERLGIGAGDTVFLTVEGGLLKIESQRARVRRVQESLNKLIDPNRCLSDELIAERREEAIREAAEDE